MGLDRYAEAFRANKIDLDVVPDLTDADLTTLGVALADRKRLLRAIAALRETAQRLRGRKPSAGNSPSCLSISSARRRCPCASTRRSCARSSMPIRPPWPPRSLGSKATSPSSWATACWPYSGWPKAHEDEPERALRAGLAAAAAVARLSLPGAGPMAARVGIATGLVVVGDLVGQGAAQEEAVVGATPNLAARLQALAELGTVVVADSTRRLLGQLFDFADLGVYSRSPALPTRSPRSRWWRPARPRAGSRLSVAEI